MSGVVDVGRSDRRPLRPQPAPIPTVAIVLGELPTPNTSQPRRPESAIAGAGLMRTASGIYLTWWRLRYGKTSARSSDPIVGGVTRYTAHTQKWAPQSLMLYPATAATADFKPP